MPPTALIESLQGIRRKVKLLSVLFGAGVVLASGVGLFLATVLLDYLLNLPAPVRLVVILAAAGTLVYALVRWVVRPALSRLTLGDVAGRLEQAFPQFEDRLRSTVDFLVSDVPGSEVMKQRVITEATTLARTTDLDRVIVTRPVWYSMLAAVGALAVLLVLGGLVSDQYRNIALSRLLTPFNAQPWPKTVQIEVVDEIPALVPVGEPVNVKVRLSRGDNARRKAIIHYRYGDGPVHMEEMVRADDGTFTARLDARTEAGRQQGLLQAWVEAGDDRLQLSQVHIVPRLAITRIEATITPPGYAQLPPVTTDLSAGAAITTVGATVSLRIGFNKPLLEGSEVVIEPVRPDQPVPAATWQMVDSFQAQGTWVAGESIRFRVRATDIHNFQNRALEEFELIVRPDTLPTVQIENPRGTEERTADAFVPLQGVTEDDYGFRSVTLVVERLGQNQQRWEIPLIRDGAALENVSWSPITAAQDRQRYRLNYQWELRELPDANLRPGDTLEYHLLVEDNFELPGEPQSADGEEDGRTVMLVASPNRPGYVVHPAVASGRLRITIISQEDLERQIFEVLANMGQAVQQLKNDQTTTRTETASLNQDTRDKPVLDNADQTALARLANQQNTAAATAKQLSQRAQALLRKMDENRFNPQTSELRDIANDVRTQLNEVAEQPMKEAGNQLNRAQQHKGDPNAPAQQQQASAQQRNEAMEQAQQAQNEAEQQLDQVAQRLKGMRPLAGFIDQIRQQLQRQEELSEQLAQIARQTLGKRPEDLTPEQREQLERLAREQQAEAQRTQQTLDAMQKAAEQLSKSDPQVSQAMNQAARTGQQQQVSQRQSQAGQQARQNQMSAASSSQRQAELGLQMILQELRDAERRQLAELAARLRELQQAVDALVRRQAGHNHDNLRLQGDKALEEAGQETLDSLIELSDRLGALPPVPDLNALANAQILTERNARNLGKSAEQVQSGAEIAAMLARAANEMERAIVYLREQKLPAAYDPPMVRALAALRDAQKKVDEARNQAEMEQERAQREAVRQAYERIRAEQVKLNAETVEVDKLPRAEDGAFRWEDRAKVAPLPGRQEKLAKDIEAVGKDLEALGSVVYTWLNSDVQRRMVDVKERLATPDTGAQTQLAQRKIVELLDEMIGNLIETQRISEFTQRPQGGGSGGGGGGGRSGRMPTEAELRLLKALQRMVLTDTESADAPERDAAWITQIGTRQGDLRNLLDTMMQKLREGKGLGPEPDPQDMLPEDAGIDDIEEDELIAQLLEQREPDEQEATGASGEEQVVEMVGDRMARSRQRLVMKTDPGPVTQEIQRRIIKDLDKLIEHAQRTMQQQQQQAQGGRRQQRPDAGAGQAPNQGQQQGQANRGNTAAQESALSGGGDPRATESGPLEERFSEWGDLPPRQRQAIIEGNSETKIPKYEQFIRDYYRSLAERMTERR